VWREDDDELQSRAMANQRRGGGPCGERTTTDEEYPGQREPMLDGHRRRCGGGRTATDGNTEEVGQLLNGWGSSPRLLQLEAG
jgi:hypothetical protein